ncbi:hypothetical protein CSB20_00620 [bacterium DOLZORAL124_64_63]|nr:MAG: hypothetical protein CSB20_00620 [bacterium DOLZORAL124_64_63]
MSAGLLLAGLLLAMAGPCPAQEVPSFDGERAMELLVRQCALGPRVPGSEGNRQLREELLAAARAGGLRAATHSFEAVMTLGQSPVTLHNIIISAGPAQGPRLWLGAHYDTRPVCDKDPDKGLRNQPLTGANDGASGVAVLWHLLELMVARPPERPVDLIFFDGEDAGISGRLSSFCVGSARLAATLGDFDNPLTGRQPEGLILLDMVGDRDLAIPMEGYSLANAGFLVEKVFGRARQLGLSAFQPVPGPQVYDDHVPFLEQGIPAVDLIDLDYRPWHTTGDVPAMCSARSLEEVGRLVTDLVYRP